MKTTVAKPSHGAMKSKNREVSDILAAADGEGSITINNILVPLDFSRPAMQALDYAIALAKQFQAQIHLIQVQVPDEASAVPGAGHLLRKCAESVTFHHQKLTGIKTEQGAQFWPENCHVRTGHAYEEICNLARELDVDLIVLASRGNTGLKRLVLGSTAERVVRFSPCPVLVVHQRKRNGCFELGVLTTTKKFRIRNILAPIDFSQCCVAGAVYAAFLSKIFDDIRRLALVALKHWAISLGLVCGISRISLRDRACCAQPASIVEKRAQ